MFGNDLNFMADKAGKKMSGENVDVVAALMDVQVAEEGLLVASANYDMLVTACENIEAGVALGEAIAAKGDEASAVVVARESLRQNLKVLGQEHVVGMVVTAGTESITAANEGITDMLKKAWEKTKEIAMKIWNWIVDLVSKVGHFLASLVGKGDTTYERLVKLVKKHKDNKMTNLDGQEFSESTQKAIAKKIKILAASKKTSSSKIVEALTGIGNKMNTFEGDKSTFGEFVDADVSIFGSDALTAGDIVEKGNTIIGKLIKDEMKANIAISGTVGLENDTKDAIVTKAEEVAGSADKGSIEILGYGFNKVYCVVIGVNDDYADASKNWETVETKQNSDEFDVAKAATTLNKLLKTVYVHEFVYEPEPSEYEDNVKDISPLEFPEVEDIMKEMKDVDKKAVKVVKSYGNKIDKHKKDIEKVLKAKFTEASGRDGAEKSVAGKLRSAVSALINIKTKISKAKASAVTNMARDLLVSPVYDYCAESAKLYKKD